MIIGCNIDLYQSFQPSHKARKNLFPLSQDFWRFSTQSEVDAFNLFNGTGEATGFDASGYPTGLSTSGSDPTVSAFAVLLDGNEGTAASGTYYIEWSGAGLDSVYVNEGGAKALTFVGTDPISGRNIASFPYNGGTLLVGMGSSVINDIRIYDDAFAGQDLDAEPWQADWLESWEQFAVIRFLDWIRTNNSELETSAQLLPEGYFSQSGETESLPIEWMVDLCNRTNTDFYLTVPVDAGDELVRYYVDYIAANLNPGLRLWIEYGNENWNSQFNQLTKIQTSALNDPTIYPLTAGVGLTDDTTQAALMYAGKRSAEIFEIAYDQYTAAGRDTSGIVRCLGGQSVNTFILESVASGASYFGASAFGGTASSFTEVSAVADYGMIGGYFYYSIDPDTTLPVIFSGNWEASTGSLPTANTSGVFYRVNSSGTVGASSYDTGHLIVAKQASGPASFDPTGENFTSWNDDPSKWFYVSGDIPDTMTGDDAAVSAVLNIMRNDINGERIQDFQDHYTSLTTGSGLSLGFYEAGSHLTTSKLDDAGTNGVGPDADDEVRILDLVSRNVEMKNLYELFLAGIDAIDSNAVYIHFNGHTRSSGVGQFGHSVDIGLSTSGANPEAPKLAALQTYIVDENPPTETLSGVDIDPSSVVAIGGTAFTLSAILSGTATDAEYAWTISPTPSSLGLQSGGDTSSPVFVVTDDPGAEDQVYNVSLSVTSTNSQVSGSTDNINVSVLHTDTLESVLISPDAGTIPAGSSVDYSATYVGNASDVTFTWSFIAIGAADLSSVGFADEIDNVSAVTVSSTDVFGKADEFFRVRVEATSPSIGNLGVTVTDTSILGLDHSDTFLSALEILGQTGGNITFEADANQVISASADTNATDVNFNWVLSSTGNNNAFAEIAGGQGTNTIQIVSINQTGSPDSTYDLYLSATSVDAGITGSDLTTSCTVTVTHDAAPPSDTLSAITILNSNNIVIDAETDLELSAVQTGTATDILYYWEVTPANASAAPVLASGTQSSSVSLVTLQTTASAGAADEDLIVFVSATSVNAGVSVASPVTDQATVTVDHPGTLLSVDIGADQTVERTIVAEFEASATGNAADINYSWEITPSAGIENNAQPQFTLSPSGEVISIVTQGVIGAPDDAYTVSVSATSVEANATVTDTAILTIQHPLATPFLQGVSIIGGDAATDAGVDKALQAVADTNISDVTFTWTITPETTDVAEAGIVVGSETSSISNITVSSVNVHDTPNEVYELEVSANSVSEGFTEVTQAYLTVIHTQTPDTNSGLQNYTPLTIRWRIKVL